jgi:hypothetical protein
MRMRLLPLLAAPLLGVAAAYLVACGGNDNLIPASDASRVQNALNEVQADYRAGKCQDAEAAVAKAKGALLNLPGSVDARLRDRLEAGVANLGKQVPASCGQSQTQTQETQTDTTTTDTTTTDTNGQTTSTPTTDTNGQTTSTPTTDTNGQTTSTPTTGTDTGTGTGTGTTTDGGTGGTPGEG